MLICQITGLKRTNCQNTVFRSLTADRIARNDVIALWKV